MGDSWAGGGGGEGVEARLIAPEEEVWARHTHILDLIEQVRMARELRRQRGIAPPEGWA